MQGEVRCCHFLCPSLSSVSLQSSGPLKRKLPCPLQSAEAWITNHYLSKILAWKLSISRSRHPISRSWDIVFPDAIQWIHEAENPPQILHLVRTTSFAHHSQCSACQKQALQARCWETISTAQLTQTVLSIQNFSRISPANTERLWKLGRKLVEKWEEEASNGSWGSLLKGNCKGTTSSSSLTSSLHKLAGCLSIWTFWVRSLWDICPVKVAWERSHTGMWLE